MTRSQLVLIILSIFVWLPLISLKIADIISPGIIPTIGYMVYVGIFSIIICPVIAIVNILCVMISCWILKSIKVLYISVLISNILFIIIGTKIIKMMIAHV